MRVQVQRRTLGRMQGKAMKRALCWLGIHARILRAVSRSEARCIRCDAEFFVDWLPSQEGEP